MKERGAPPEGDVVGDGLPLCSPAMRQALLSCHGNKICLGSPRKDQRFVVCGVA